MDTDKIKIYGARVRVDSMTKVRCYLSEAGMRSECDCTAACPALCMPPRRRSLPRPCGASLARHAGGRH